MRNHTNSYKNTQKLEHKLEHKKRRKKAKSYKKRDFKFTHLSILHLKCLARRKIYWSSDMSGFGVEVTPYNSKIWVYQYRFDNKTRRMTLGKFPKVSLRDATKLYLSASEKVLYGIDPLEERKKEKEEIKGELTVNQLIDAYLTYCKKTEKKTYKCEERAFNKNLPEHLRSKKISDVQSEEIAKIVNKIIMRGSPTMAKHLFSYLRRMYNYAADIGLLKRRDNPCLDIKLSIKMNRRSRHLSPKEIFLFWHNIEKIPMSPVMRLSIKFLFLTVVRPINIREMRWSEVDMSSYVWTLPKTKNGRLHRVYLGGLAIEILNEVKEYTGGGTFVFGSIGNFKTCKKNVATEKKRTVMSKWVMSKPFRRHFSKFEIEEKFYPYDLRRTGATLISGLFGRKELVVLALNHTTSTVTDIYDQYAYDKEKKMSMEALNKAIEIIINSNNVESVPNFEQLREQVFKQDQSVSIACVDDDHKKQDFQASFSSPVTYKLSFDHPSLSGKE